MEAHVATRSGRARIRIQVRPFLAALLAGDQASAIRLATDALALLGSRVAVFSDLLQPAQFEIGELWYAGRIGVADEHRATAIVESVVKSLPATPSRDPVPPGSRCLLATLGDEQHVLGLQVLRLSLDDEGWTTEWLGARVPLERVLELVMARPPHVVALSSAYLPAVQPLKLAIDRIKLTGARVLVGGPAFNRNPDLFNRIGADGQGSDARMSLVLARRLLAR
ncbi:MAG: hypothetical protein NVS9B11_21950 [Candidatus Dormibacteraceae bacterium]